MGLSMREKKAVSRQVAMRYQKARKKEKNKILDEFIQVTGYTRWYGSYVLRNLGKKVVIKGKGGRLIRHARYYYLLLAETTIDVLMWGDIMRKTRPTSWTSGRAFRSGAKIGCLHLAPGIISAGK